VPDKRGRGASFRVEFDDTTFAEDHAYGTPAGRDAALKKRATVERDGQPAEELITCDAEAQDGTKLPGCFKTYVPWPTGRWGMVFEFRFDEDHRPYLAFFRLRSTPPPARLPRPDRVRSCASSDTRAAATALTARSRLGALSSACREERAPGTMWRKVRERRESNPRSAPH
jgi:hypothetical protein